MLRRGKACWMQLPFPLGAVFPSSLSYVQTAARSLQGLFFLCSYHSGIQYTTILSLCQELATSRQSREGQRDTGSAKGHQGPVGSPGSVTTWPRLKHRSHVIWLWESSQPDFPSLLLCGDVQTEIVYHVLPGRLLSSVTPWTFLYSFIYTQYVHALKI